jgi:hypothetical protein
MSQVDTAAQIYANLPNTVQNGLYAAMGQANQQAATDALAGQYGARAYNPGLATALQNQDIAYNKDQRAQATLPFDLANKQATTNYYNANTAKTQQGTTAANTATQQKAVLGLVNGLRMARDQGKDLGAAFDQLTSTMPGLNIDPSQKTAMRAELINDPTILDRYYATLTGTPGVLPKSTGSGTTSSKAAATVAQEAEGRKNVSQLVGEARTYVQNLKDLGAMNYEPPGGGTVVGNVARSLSTGSIGQTVRGMVDHRVATATQNLTGLRAQLFNAYRAATGMPASELRSQKEFMANLDAVTDPTNTYETAMAKLDRFEKMYGLSSAPGAASSATPSAPTKSVSDYGFSSPDAAYASAQKAIAAGADPAKAAALLQNMGLDPSKLGQ